MSNRSLNLTAPVYDYLLSKSLREHDVLRQLREKTVKMEMGKMQIAPEQGQFFAMLVKLINAKKIIEVGVFTGYSSLAMALAMPDEGKIVACDVSEEWTSIAREYWQRAGVENKIELRLAPAMQTLQQLIDAGQHGQFDLAFIDADKTSYRNYYEACLQLVRPGGLIAIDNVLWGGSVVDSSDISEDTQAIRELNDFLYQDNRVDLSLIPVGDGITLARRL